MKEQLLIFDLDGTLVDSRKDLATAVNLMRGRFDLPPLPVDTVASYVGAGVRELVKAAMEGRAVDMEKALRLQKSFYMEHMLDETVLYPGVKTGLRRLRAAGHTLAVATNKVAEAAEKMLVRLGVRPFFSEVAGAGKSGGKLKPEPDMIFDIMASAGAVPGETWVVGDNHTDIEAARRAGVRSIFAQYGFGRAGSERANLVLKRFADLVALFPSVPGAPR